MPTHLIQVDENTETNILAIGTANNACPGQFYYATDTEKYYFGKQDGTLEGPIPSDGGDFTNYGEFNDDASAGAGGCPIGGYYTLSDATGYGGIVKMRRL